MDKSLVWPKDQMANDQPSTFAQLRAAIVDGFTQLNQHQDAIKNLFASVRHKSALCEEEGAITSKKSLRKVNKTQIQDT